MSSGNSCSTIRLTCTVKLGIISVAQTIMGVLTKGIKCHQRALVDGLERTMQKNEIGYKVRCLDGSDVMLAVMAESFPHSFVDSFNHDMLTIIKGKVCTAMGMQYLSNSPEPDFAGVMAALIGGASFF